MICPICKHGETASGEVTVTLERGAMTLVVKKVPALVCENCGEKFVSEATTRRLLEQAEQAAAEGVQIEVRPYAA